MAGSYGFWWGAMTALIRKRIVDKKKWMDENTFDSGLALCQVIPGAIVMQLTVCVFTPSFLILMGIIPFFDKLKTYPQFNKVINGVLCSFVGLLAVITYRFSIDIHWNLINIIFTLISFVLLMCKIDVIWVVLAGILISFFYINNVRWD